MGLVAEVLQDEQRLRAAGDPQGLGLARQVDLLQPLGQADHRDVQAAALEDLHGHAELPPPAVDDHQPGRVRELPGPPRSSIAVRRLGLQASEPAGQDLLHRGEVVLAGHALDLETAVVAALGEAVLEHHHGPDGVRRPQVRDVVGLDAQGRGGQPQHVAELGQGARASPEVRGPLELVAQERVLRVARDGLQQPAALSPLGDLDPDPTPRRSDSHVSRTSRSTGHSGTNTDGGTSSRSMYSSRRKSAISDAASRCSTLSTIHPRRPTTRPPRTTNTWKAASRSSSSRATTSKSIGRAETISCCSMALRAAASWSRNRAAASYSWRSAELRIPASRTLRIGLWSPARKPSMPSTISR